MLVGPIETACSNQPNVCLHAFSLFGHPRAPSFAQTTPGCMPTYIRVILDADNTSNLRKWIRICQAIPTSSNPCHIDHVPAGSLDGFAIGRIARPTGTAECEQALELIDRYLGSSSRRTTLRNDKTNDVVAFIADCWGADKPAHTIDSRRSKTGKSLETAIDTRVHPTGYPAYVSAERNLDASSVCDINDSGSSRLCLPATKMPLY